MPDEFLNLEQAVTEWAWREFDNTASSREKKLRQKELKKKQKCLDVVIDWSKTRFNDVTKWSRIGEEAETTIGNDVTRSGGAATASSSGVGRGLQFGPGRLTSPGMSVLFETKFTNNTIYDQEYTMKTEKTTRRSLSTCVERGLTKGFEMGIKLTTPCEVLEANAGYRREVTLTNSDGETIDEEMTWGVESIIHVKGEHVAEAQLVVNERKQDGEFQIESRFSGMVYVTFTNLKENNAFVKETGHDVAEIVAEYLEREKKKEHLLPYVRIEKNVVIVTTGGRCHFRYGVSQEVKVKQRPIGPDDQ